MQRMARREDLVSALFSSISTHTACSFTSRVSNRLAAKRDEALLEGLVGEAPLRVVVKIYVDAGRLAAGLVDAPEQEGQRRAELVGLPPAVVGERDARLDAEREERDRDPSAVVDPAPERQELRNAGTHDRCDLGVVDLAAQAGLGLLADQAVGIAQREEHVLVAHEHGEVVAWVGGHPFTSCRVTVARPPENHARRTWSRSVQVPSRHSRRTVTSRITSRPAAVTARQRVAHSRATRCGMLVARRCRSKTHTPW